jgi:hypothetical protein
MWIVVKVCRVFLRWHVCEPGTRGDTAAEALPVGVMWAQGGSMPHERVVFALKLEEGRLTFLIYVFLWWHWAQFALPHATVAWVR